MTDIEGVAGVESWEQTQCGPRHEAAKALATAELNGVLSAFLGPPERTNSLAPRVSVWDGHGYGGLLPAQVDPRVTLYAHDDSRGFTGLLKAALGEEVPVDALGFVGQHAMEGSGGTLSHTYSSRRIRRYTLNGRPIGEFDLRTLYAWSQAKIPSVFFSGDDVACREALALVPGIVAVSVKDSLGLTSARHMPPDDACAALAAGAELALARDIADASLHPSFSPLAPFEFRKHYKLKFGFIPRPPRVWRGKTIAEVLETE